MIEEKTINQRDEKLLTEYTVNPLHYRFKKVDKEMAEETGKTINDPIVLFDLKGMGVSLEGLKDGIAETYETLPWDMYLVKRDQIDFIIELFPNKKEVLQTEVLPRYFADEIGVSDLKEYTDQFSDDQRAEFEKIRPYRRRGISEFMLHKSEANAYQWQIEELPYTPYTQDSDVENDYRQLVRKFPPSPKAVTQNKEFREILAHLAAITDISEGSRTKKIKIICQQVGIVTDLSQQVSNAPEGIHQDGCDYIVSALVVERKNIIHGESVVYGPDKKTEYLNCILQDGEGIFQADTGSPLWHVVKPILPESSNQNQPGIRNIIGYDIYVVE